MSRREARRRARADAEGAWYPRWFWPMFVVPAALVLAVLFLFPFYAVIGVAFGRLDPVFRTPLPEWNPAMWDRVTLSYTMSNLLRPDGLYHAAVIRTFEYVIMSTALCLVLGYPFAYFIARHAGRFKTAFLIAFFAPFLISYMMRMTAWVNLLQDNGYINRIIQWLHLSSTPYPWLSGKGLTVVFGLVYGYIPLMILPLYAALDRIPQGNLEAARDLGASPASTFRRVTLPASKQAIIAGVLLCGLAMFGDYFTNQLLAGTTGTRMIGNWIFDALSSPHQVPRGATLALLLTLLLVPLIVYYLRVSRRTTRNLVV
jgi:ABC-type spermidine/putrescine transport system permease subunit I